MKAENKIYILYGLNAAISLLRPNARWEITNGEFTVWDDPRPQPSWNEIEDTIKKIKLFEDSINTIWLPEQLEEMKKHNKALENEITNNEYF